jgi:ubiquinone/menaquinone biosynthesis C-methylase UbiE
MTYILENKAEAERLKKQNSQPQYSIQEELKHLKLVLNGKKILDAGCGVGSLSEILERDYYSEIHACDASEIRIHQAKKSCSKNINFFTADLKALPEEKNQFDVIFVRFVLEHSLDPKPLISELFRVLKPGGHLVVIDFDGLIFNIDHRNAELKSYLDKLQQELPIDLFIGRKLPRLLTDEGFQLEECHIQGLSFLGQDLESEQKNMEMRFNQTEPLIKQILGEDKFEVFSNLYLSEMKKSQMLFCNKFIISSKKPE